MIPLLDPISFALYVVGYIVMLLVASAVAPRVASAVSGRFTLYGAMALAAALIVLTTALVIYLFLTVAMPAVTRWGLNFFIGMILFVVFMNLVTYLASPYIINAAYGARPDARLQRIVDEVASRLGLAFRVRAVVVDGPPNAFAYGNLLTGRYVAVTTGMLAIADRRELEAVIGHELGHHAHRDNALMLLFGLLPSVIYYLGISSVHMALASSSESRGGGSAVLAIFGVIAVIISFLVQLLVLAFSRLREYYADMAGAIAAGKETMQFALTKIHKYYHVHPEDHETVRDSKFRTLFIYALVGAVANPFIAVTRRDVEELKRAEYPALMEILSTHPPIPKRLRFLDELQLGIP